MENQKNILAPICLFVYSRLDETKKTIESLQQNILASESHLYVFSDGEKNEENRKNVLAVREYIHSINGFASVKIYESNINKGLANSIISGVTEIVNKYGKIIVIEDDLIFSTNFICFMNQALNFYENKKRVANISGYAFDFKYPSDYKYDMAFSCRFSSWGWATWKDRWEKVDWEVKDYKSFRWNIFNRIRFYQGGSDLDRMLRLQMKGKLDSWAIRFAYHHFKYDLLDIFPRISKVLYNGFNSGATHTQNKKDTFDTVLDSTENFNFQFSENLETEKEITKQFYNHYSFKTRLNYKISQIRWKKNQ